MTRAGRKSIGADELPIYPRNRLFVVTQGLVIFNHAGH
jgi:hypothetical protein